MTNSDFTTYGRVYLINNSANGKCYVGQTIQPIATRFRQHCQLQAKCRALEAAIRKYGAECFTIVELAVATTQDELNELEARYVRELSTMAPTGYNLREGGGAKGGLHEETKELLRQNGRRPQVIAQLAALNSSPKRRAELRENGVKNWHLVEGKMKVALADIGVQKRRIEAIKAAWTCPTLLEKQRAFIAEMQQRPDVMEKRSATLKSRWAAMTPEQREAEGLKISKSLIGHKKKIDYSPEAKAHRKEIAVKRWQDPKNRAALLAANSDPEVVKKRGDAIRAGWALRRDRIAAEKAASN